MMLFFFGCIRSAGHHLFDTSHQLYDVPRSMPWSYQSGLDPAIRGETWGARPPAMDVWMVDEQQTEGKAVLSHKQGWTRLGWADRSADSRRGSHANIIAEGHHTFEQMLEFARTHFPTVMARMNYKIELGRTVDIEDKGTAT